MYKQNGYAYTNCLLNEIAFQMNMLIEYIGLDFTVDQKDNLSTALEEYDLLDKMGLIQVLLDKIDPEEYSAMAREYSNKIQTEINMTNSLESILNKHLSNLYNTAKQLAEILPQYKEELQMDKPHIQENIGS